jgi:hypothetical protein
MPFLAEHFPQLVPLYRARFANRAFLPPDYQKRISMLVSKLCWKHGIGIRQHESGVRTSGIELSRQLSLFAP